MKNLIIAFMTLMFVNTFAAEKMGEDAADVYHRLLKLGKWNHLLINDLYLQGS